MKFILLFLLAGCSTFDDGMVRDRPMEPKSIVHIEVADFAQYCAKNSAPSDYGCAVRIYSSQTCIIYTNLNPPQWVVDEERKHCYGWNHSQHDNGTIRYIPAW